MSASVVDRWVDELVPDAVARDQVDVSTIDVLAHVLDLDRDELSIGLRGVLWVHGERVSPFEIRTNTWRVDLPAGLVRVAVSGVVSAGIIAATGASALPIALLGLVAPLLFSVERVELVADDVLVHARLRAVVGDGPNDLAALHEALPAGVRAEMSLAELTEVVDRLLGARLATADSRGVRLRAPGRPRGFRLLMAPPSLVPALSAVSARLPPATTNSGGQEAPRQEDGPRLAKGYPQVFISYAHENADHKAAVLALAECLHAEGVGIVLDQDSTAQRKDWQLWATNCILNADYVLVIASPLCRVVGDGNGDPATNLGLRAEMRTLRDLYASDYPTWSRRILPVLLPGASVSEIPLFLEPTNVDRYHLAGIDSAGVLGLLQVMTSP